MVGLGNADNTSDVNKPISTATQTALNLKARSVNGQYPDGVYNVYVDAAHVPSGALGESDVQADLDSLGSLITAKQATFIQTYSGTAWSTLPSVGANDLVIASSASTQTGTVAPPSGTKKGRVWVFFPGTA